MLNIRQKDLNLLVVLVAIAEELNLSRAAVRLGLSQPALSHALARLREQFGDPLFVRGQRGLAATPRAENLLPRVRSLVDQAGDLYAPEAFDLAKLRRKVVIASTPYFEARALPAFIRLARTKAPELEIETYSLGGGFPRRELESGEFDLAIAAYFDDLPNGFLTKTVFKDHFVCLCSSKNSYLKTKRSAADYLACEHLQIEVPAGVFAPVDQYLSAKKRRREIALRIGNFLTPPAILAETDLLLTCPLSLAESYRKTHPLALTELPFRLPSIDTKMVWHEKNQRDPFHAWLREQI